MQTNKNYMTADGKYVINMNHALPRKGRIGKAMNINEFKMCVYNKLLTPVYEHCKSSGNNAHIREIEGFINDFSDGDVSNGMLASLFAYGINRRVNSFMSIIKDLNKINWTFDDLYVNHGIETLHDMPYIQITLGEFGGGGMIFYVYYDGIQFRAYIPTLGNVLDIKDKSMFECLPDVDATAGKYIYKELQDIFPEGFISDIMSDIDDTFSGDELSELDNFNEDQLTEFYENIFGHIYDEILIYPDEEACLQDFEARMVIK